MTWFQWVVALVLSTFMIGAGVAAVVMGIRDGLIRRRLRKRFGGEPWTGRDAVIAGALLAIGSLVFLVVGGGIGIISLFLQMPR